MITDLMKLTHLPVGNGTPNSGGNERMLLSLVIPVYNEEEVLSILFPTLRGVLQQIDCDYEIVFVNDGSRDRSSALIRQEGLADHRVKLLEFSRNFGHQIAITAGLDAAQGDAVVVMDADLQDPPEVLIDMVMLYRQGFDVVSAQRSSRGTDTFFKRFSAAMFYKLMKSMVDERLQPEIADFRLFSRSAVVAIRSFREQHRFMRGLVAWLGLKEAILPFERKARAAGVTKYPLHKMLRFAWTGISSFSGVPLRFAMTLGALLTLAGVVYLAYAAVAALSLHETVPGWASLIAIQVTFSGATLLALGIMGDYVSRIYEEIKHRPLYIVNDAANISIDPGQATRALVLGPARTAVSKSKL
jgi:polyisoprenyl-phosphate glycosyltransferase